VKTLGDLIAGIKASQTAISLALAHGKAPNWDAYNRLTGQYQGLQDALDILNNLMKEDENE
jgi:hypothetical protein